MYNHTNFNKGGDEMNFFQFNYYKSLMSISILLDKISKHFHKLSFIIFRYVKNKVSPPPNPSIQKVANKIILPGR